MAEVRASALAARLEDSASAIERLKQQLELATPAEPLPRDDDDDDDEAAAAESPFPSHDENDHENGADARADAEAPAWQDAPTHGSAAAAAADDDADAGAAAADGRAPASTNVIWRGFYSFEQQQWFYENLRTHETTWELPEDATDGDIQYVTEVS